MIPAKFDCTFGKRAWPSPSRPAITIPPGAPTTPCTPSDLAGSGIESAGTVLAFSTCQTCSVSHNSLGPLKLGIPTTYCPRSFRSSPLSSSVEDTNQSSHSRVLPRVFNRLEDGVFPNKRQSCQTTDFPCRDN